MDTSDSIDYAINGVPTYVRSTVHQHHTVLHGLKVRLQINHQTMHST